MCELKPIDTAPMDGTMVVGAWNWGGWNYCIMRWRNGWTKPFHAEPCYTPSHWAPLPSPQTREASK